MWTKKGMYLLPCSRTVLTRSAAAGVVKGGVTWRGGGAASCMEVGCWAKKLVRTMNGPKKNTAANSGW